MPLVSLHEKCCYTKQMTYSTAELKMLWLECVWLCRKFNIVIYQDIFFKKVFRIRLQTLAGYRLFKVNFLTTKTSPLEPKFIFHSMYYLFKFFISSCVGPWHTRRWLAVYQCRDCRLTSVALVAAMSHVPLALVSHCRLHCGLSSVCKGAHQWEKSILNDESRLPIRCYGKAFPLNTGSGLSMSVFIRSRSLSLSADKGECKGGVGRPEVTPLSTMQKEEIILHPPLTTGL